LKKKKVRDNENLNIRVTKIYYYADSRELVIMSRRPNRRATGRKRGEGEEENYWIMV